MWHLYPMDQQGLEKHLLFVVKMNHLPLVFFKKMISTQDMGISHKFLILVSF